MEWAWLLGVYAGLLSTTIAGSVGDSLSLTPTYLIFAPGTLHPGTPTPLAVTLLTVTPVRVTAQLIKGNTSVLQAEETFQPGMTGLLTLPAIPEGFPTQGLFYTLVVKGYEGNTTIFTNTTSLNFDSRTFSTFIHTDKPKYSPADRVQMRIVSVQADNQPLKGSVDIAVWDPLGKVVQRWNSVESHLGIVSTEFQLSRNSPLGLWRIVVTVNGIVTEREIVVEDHEPPYFDVVVLTAPVILLGNDISGTVKAQHPDSHIVHGILSIYVELVSASNTSGHPFILNQSKEIHGATEFFFSRDSLPAGQENALDLLSGNDSIILSITASVAEVSTGLKMNRTVAVNVTKKPFDLTFNKFPHVLKPSLHFSTQLQISRYDGQPLSTLDRINRVSVEVTQMSTKALLPELTPQDTMAKEVKTTSTMTLSMPEDGIVHIEFVLQDQVKKLVIQALFISSKAVLELYNNHLSPNGYYIQIQPITAFPVQLGQPLHISVESTFQLTVLHYVVTSRGQVVAVGTQHSESFYLSPTVSWVPIACVTVYCVQPDGGITNHAVHIPVVPRDRVSLNWSGDTGVPGDEAAFSVAVSELVSLMGVLAMGMEDPAPGLDHDIPEEKVFNRVVLTDARLQRTGDFDQFALARKEARLMSDNYWRDVIGQAQTWLWVDGNISESTLTSVRVTAPDSKSSWRATALVISESRGSALSPVGKRVKRMLKDFSMSLDVPAYIIRGEQLVLEVHIVNNLKTDLEMVVVVAESNSYKFVLAEQGDLSMVNARKIVLKSQGAATILFPIRPLVLGNMEINVDAISAEASDTIARTMLVKAEGIEQAISDTLFLELAPSEHSFSTTIPFSFPPDVVPGSQRAHVAVVGDILGLSINNLESLVQIPHSCGEQNMVHFAPHVYILQFLEKSPKKYPMIQDWARQAMMEGYQRELSYQRDDGSFSVFGSSDASGSTWLTAFVLRCFLQGRAFIQMDQSVISRAMAWLVDKQGPQGSFTEAGRTVHTELQEGPEDSTVALTAFVMMTLLENTTAVATVMSPGNISLTLQYLENRVNSDVSSNYSLCLMAYALALANSPVAATALAQLSTRADMKDGVMTWSSSRGPVSHSWQASSVQIEMASYVMLALYQRASIVEGIDLMKWLSKQRHYLGGYGTTQDTVVAIQALSYYAAFSGSDAIDVTVSITSGSRPVSRFVINSTSYLLPQSQEIDATKDLLISMEGRGFALLQRNVFYNLKSSALSQGYQNNADHKGFSLKVNVMNSEGDLDHILLSICTRLLESQMFPQTGMVLLDVGLLSGFILQPDSVATGDLIRKVETSPGQVSLYLDSLTTSEVCIALPLIRAFRVALVQDALVQVYDYYEPRRRAVQTYNSDLLRNMDSCSFCGSTCKECGSGISRNYADSAAASMTITVWGLGCLFAAVTAFVLS